MYAQQLAAEIDAARTPARLDNLAHTIWKSAAAGAITDDAAQLLAERIHTKKNIARREAPRVGIPAGRPSIFPPRRYQCSPDRKASKDRRRRLAASGPMPPRLAAMFTTSELAVLQIVGDEIRHKTLCDATLAEIAARAGVCRTTAKNALRQAAALGLLWIEERRRRGQKNLPNIVRIIAKEWLEWLKKRPVQQMTTGGKSLPPTQPRSSNLSGKDRGQPSNGPAPSRREAMRGMRATG